MNDLNDYEMMSAKPIVFQESGTVADGKAW